MLDARLRPLIDGPLNSAGRGLVRLGIGANAVTLVGIAVGLGAAAAIANGEFLAGLVFILLNRLLDGLDGAVARASRLTDFGGYLDIVSDFIFYVSVPVGFGVSDSSNTVPALLLVASFTITGISFLAFATLAGKRGLETEAHGRKSFFYNSGIAEGTETIIAFVLMTLLPGSFGTIAMIYAGLCVITVGQRSLSAFVYFKD